MENIISIANCWEKVEIGYVSTHVKMNRVTNEVLSVTYHWHEKFSTNNTKVFNSFESLNVFLYLIKHNANVVKQANEIVDEYNALIRKRKAERSSASFILNGDMAQEFHESYPSDEDDDRFDE